MPTLMPSVAEGETHRIGSIVRNGERPDRNIADLKAVPGFKALEFFQLRPLAFLVAQARAHAWWVAPVMNTGMRSFFASVASP